MPDLFATLPNLPDRTADLMPFALLALCVVGGVGTFLLLPSRKPISTRRLGGVLLLLAAAALVALLVQFAASEFMGVYFWTFSAIALAASVRVVTHPKPVYAALYFVLTVFATAGLFLLLWADFMAAALVLIYAGAILVTYVFVIMLAAEASGTTGEATGGLAEHDLVSREPLVASAVGFALMGVILSVIFAKGDAAFPILGGAPMVAAAAGADPPTVTQQLGLLLFTHHVVSLQIAGLILTIAMIGAIVIAKRKVHVPTSEAPELKPDVVSTPSTPVGDNPHTLPVQGIEATKEVKLYPED